jgi:antitoxin ParD1/3/4
MDRTTTLHVSLPKALKKYVKERVGEKQYSNPSDYVRTLIREDQARRDEEHLERMLVEGLASGAGTTMNKKTWQELHASVSRGGEKHTRGV